MSANKISGIVLLVIALVILYISYFADPDMSNWKCGYIAVGFFLALAFSYFRGENRHGS